MNKEEAFKEINDIQDYYVNELLDKINNPDYLALKYINFTSPTGTGKTKMISKLINKNPEIFFIVTTLSKGQLSTQIRTSLNRDCLYDNFVVYGLSDFRINSKLQAEDIISKLPQEKCIWIRDEGHIKTNRYEELLSNRCLKIINFSATNKYSDIKCNFTQTMMLRTVKQQQGSYIEALDKLVEIKNQHKRVKEYNPCAIIRHISNDEKILQNIFKECEKRKLKYINITEENFDMSALCQDNNEYDVIINKFKLVEGIDIRRAHVLWMENQPKNDSTTIQAIGRCRRNALLYRNDIDIFDKENSELLKNTRICWVFYNVVDMKISTDENGELQNAFCDIISCEDIKPNTWIEVKDGFLNNGLQIYELKGCTGKYFVEKDSKLNMNYIKNVPFYKRQTLNTKKDKYVYMNLGYEYSFYAKVNTKDITKLPFYIKNGHKFYYVDRYKYSKEENVKITNEVKTFFNNGVENLINELTQIIKGHSVDNNNFILPNKLYTKKYLKSKEKESIEKAIEQFRFDYKGTCYTGDEVMSEEEKTIIGWYIWKNQYRNIHYYFYDEVKRVMKIKISLFTSEFNKNKNISIKDFLSLEIFYDILINKEQNIRWVPIMINFCVLRNDNDKNLEVMHDDCVYYFSEVKKQVSNENIIYLNANIAIKYLTNTLAKIKEDFNNGSITLAQSCEKIFKKINKNNFWKSNKGQKEPYEIISEDSFKNFHSYTIKFNEKESSIIGFDTMKTFKNESLQENIWIEDSSVTSKITKYCKFNKFIEQKYQKEINKAKKDMFGGANDFALDKKCNSMIGICVEYYAKYLLFGRGFFKDGYEWGRFLDKSTDQKQIDAEIIRACMLKYKEEMSSVYGQGMNRIIKTISIERMIKNDYENFMNLVIELGNKTAEYVKENFYKNIPIRDNYVHNLSISHISGIADFISQDTILDVKVKNCITMENVKQVLAYHYLSTKRTDLNIKEVIIYDATSGKDLKIQIEPENLTAFFNPEDVPKID